MRDCLHRSDIPRRSSACGAGFSVQLYFAPKKKVKVATYIYHDAFQLVVPGSLSSSTSRSSAIESFASCPRVVSPRRSSACGGMFIAHCMLRRNKRSFEKWCDGKKHVVQRPRRSSACGARACVATETAFILEYRVVSSSVRPIHHDAFQLVVQGPRRMYVSHVCHACRRCTVWNSCILCVFCVCRCVLRVLPLCLRVPPQVRVHVGVPRASVSRVSAFGPSTQIWVMQSAGHAATRH